MENGTRKLFKLLWIRKKIGLQQQFRSFPILFEMVYPFLSLGPLTSPGMFDAALRCHAEGSGCSWQFRSLAHRVGKGPLLCSHLRHESEPKELEWRCWFCSTLYPHPDPFSRNFAVLHRPTSVSLPLSALSPPFLFLTPWAPTAFAFKTSQTGPYPVKLWPRLFSTGFYLWHLLLLRPKGQLVHLVYSILPNNACGSLERLVLTVSPAAWVQLQPVQERVRSPDLILLQPITLQLYLL